MASNSKPGFSISITGALIIGILEIIISILGIVYVGIGFIQSFQASSKQSFIHKAIQEVTLGLEFIKNWFWQPNDNSLNFHTQIVNLLPVVGSIVGVVLASILIHGIMKERLRLLQARMIIHGILIFSVSAYIIYIIIEISFSLTSLSTFLFTAVVTYGIVCFTVVYDACVQIRKKLVQRQHVTNPSLKGDQA